MRWQRLPLLPAAACCCLLPQILIQSASAARCLLQAIIGAIGEIDAYQLPDAKGFTALNRYLLGVTDEERQRRREEVLGTSNKDFK
jgi:Zn-dependent M16 (insulinase) family peptidase